MNSVTLIGNLASDVETKELADDKSVASFLLAVDRAPAEGADFVRVSAWNKQGELCARFLSKGRRVAVNGRLRSRSWEEGDKRRSALEVVADRVEFLSRPGRSGSEDGEQAAVAV